MEYLITFCLSEWILLHDCIHHQIPSFVISLERKLVERMSRKQIIAENKLSAVESPYFPSNSPIR